MIGHLPWRDDPHRISAELGARMDAAYKAEQRFVEWFEFHSFNVRERLEEGRETKLYFICAEDGSRFKIGYSATPRKRLKDLQVGSPVALALASVVPARESLETYLHEVLAADRVRGEWYAGSPRVLAVASIFLSAEQQAHDYEASCEPDDKDVADPDFTLASLFWRVEDALWWRERELQGGAAW